MATFIAFFDANVLYPAELRSLLMYLALIGVFRARWSDDVHEEWITNLLMNRPDLTATESLSQPNLASTMKRAALFLTVGRSTSGKWLRDP